jgi:hypothetical protein
VVEVLPLLEGAPLQVRPDLLDAGREEPKELSILERLRLHDPDPGVWPE